MSRTRGAKDRKPRRMAEASLANMPVGNPGYRSVVVRVYGPASDVRWFEGLSSHERGQAVSQARLTMDG